ncbi:DUF294 nucleotidyltransferase-like domain-containing protein [Amaricoccus sp.]|uniref:DUF294 nucleotidyltransferase-like domain-containing protein n=1 Tax=Amaricoccus sp. TaxID=1872485 RepID=UPI001B6F77A8|nr:DUF294 nucleotidyltransferase-like domain-containing protein [Amaricoccus sp.]MBP7003171.1 CBS domain-containing protein [Amaricoccus sp.]
MRDEPGIDTADFLRRHAPFDRMAIEDLDFLAARLRPISFAAGEVVTQPEAGPAQWLYVLREGRIVGRDREAGAVEWEMVEGDCFPLGALADERPVHSDRRAATDAVCLAMDRAGFEELRARSDVFAEFCASRIAGLVRRADRDAAAERAGSDAGDGSLNVPLAARALPAPVTAGPETPIGAALRTMSERRIGSIVVVDGAERPIGIFTLKDLLNRVALPGRPLDTPIGRVMTPDPVGVPQDAFAFEAAMAMAEAGVRHVVVVDEGRLVGVVSERDLFAMQRVGLVNLTKAIAAAGSIGEVASLARDLHRLVGQMMAQGVKGAQIAQIITLVNDQTVERVIDLTLAETGAPPFPFTWLAFGSEGRKEQTLKTDQDNGILYETPEGMTDVEARAVLLPIAERVNLALDAVGFTLCPGEVMARNPDCCLSAREWRARFQRWMRATTPENLLNASIYFDFRPVWGPGEAAEALRAWLLDAAADNGLFRRQMAANALRNAPPLGGVFRDFRLSGDGAEENTLDLKVNGATPFVDAARILALGRGVAATNTVERLAGVAKAGGISPADAEAWIAAYDYIRMLRMRLNEEQVRRGTPLGNRVDPARLNDLDRRILRESFKEARRLQQSVAVAFQL